MTTNVGIQRVAKVTVGSTHQHMTNEWREIVVEDAQGKVLLILTVWSAQDSELTVEVE